MLQLYAMTDWRHGFHFFGRNDIEAWSSDGSRLLRCRTQQLPHDMDPADSLAVGHIPFSEGVCYGISWHIIAYCELSKRKLSNLQAAAGHTIWPGGQPGRRLHHFFRGCPI